MQFIQNQQTDNKDININQANILSQVVDTLHLHLYQTELTDITKYNQFVDDLLYYKKEAQQIKNSNNELRYVNTNIGQYQFRVMASSVNGFSVTLINDSVSISFRKNENNYVSHSPLIKIEFRSQYLVLNGYLNAINEVLDLFKNHIIYDYKIKVNRIDLATDIQAYQFTEFDKYKIQTLKHDKTSYEEPLISSYMKCNIFSGFSVGKGDFMVRVYNKTLELKKNPNKAYIKDYRWKLNSNYKDNEDVWRIEIQYRRPLFKLFVYKDGYLDGFETVLNAIPDLWNKGLELCKFKDVPTQNVINHIAGYKRLKDGTTKAISPFALSRYKQRADINPSLLPIYKWNSSNSYPITKIESAKIGAYEYAKNQVKGLFSTLHRFKGEITKDDFQNVFIDAEKDIFESKKMTMFDWCKYKDLQNFIHTKQHQIKYGVIANFNYTKSHMRNLLDWIDDAYSYIDISYQSVLLEGKEYLQNCISGEVVF